MQRSGKGAAAMLDCLFVKVFLPWAFRSASPTGIHADQSDRLAAISHDLAKRANTAPEISSYLDKTTAAREMFHRLFLG